MLVSFDVWMYVVAFMGLCLSGSLVACMHGCMARCLVTYVPASVHCWIRAWCRHMSDPPPSPNKQSFVF